MTNNPTKGATKLATRVANTVADLQSYLQSTIGDSQFELTPVPFSAQDAWQPTNGMLSHKTGGFFHVIGLQHTDTGRQHLALYQPQSALTGLLVCRQNNQWYVMVQARIEPGNIGIGQYGPTIQSTPANYMRLHGGKATPYLDCFMGINPHAQPIAATTHFDLGKRYYQKDKTVSYVETTHLLPTEENMIWTPLPVLAQALALDNFINTDLRTFIAVMDWDVLTLKNTLPKPAKLNAAVLYDSHKGLTNYRIIPINDLVNWQFGQTGVEATQGQGVDAPVYHVTCTNREVNSWYQPLFRTGGQGLVVLLVRQASRGLEYLLSIHPEWGINGQLAVHPSFVWYGEERNPDNDPDFKEISILADTIQSEEGGRFYKDENRYRVLEVGPDYAPNEHQHWVNAATLKAVLKSSGRPSIQLRCAAALLVGRLNPITFNHSN